MNRIRLTQGVVFAIATSLLTVHVAARQGESRPTDKAVEQVISSVEKARNAFEAAIDDKAKASIVRTPRGELRLDAYLNDLETSVKNLKGKFGRADAAVGEAEAVLRQASHIDQFVQTSGQGMKGAAEWTTLTGELRRLASAYTTTFPLAATGGSVRRINDADASSAADDMKRQAQRLRDSVDGNAGLAADVREAAKAELAGLEKQADLVKARINSGQAASAEMKQLLAHAAAIDKFFAANKIMPQTQAYWEAARVPLDKLKQAYAVKAPTPRP